MKRNRPTNSRIEQLEKENAFLRKQWSQLETGSIGTVDRARLNRTESPLASLSPAHNRPTASSISSHVEPSPREQHSTRGRDTSHPEVPDSDNRRTSASLYHGPTSTVYDDTANLEANEENGESSNSLLNEECARHLLFAQTARERQMEPLNLAARKLDFDEVNPELGMHLLSIYWSRQLYTAQIIYRPVFMRDMACNGPYFSKLLLNAVLFTVSKHCPRPELRSDPDDITTAGWRFRQRFTELLRDSFDKSEITTLQALLVMSNSLFSRCDERSLSWLYAGNAFNMIIDLGLHVLPSPSLIPPLLRQVNFKASLNFLDEYDELDAFKDITYNKVQHQYAIPSLNVSLLTKLCELSIISERILCELYSESQNMSQSQNHKIAKDINSDLARWRSSLPPQLDYLSHPDQSLLLPQAFCLLALSNVLVILSQRPLFTGNNGHARHSTTAFEAVNVCTTAANYIVQILRDYSQHFLITTAPYIMSYATYIGATIHARIVAQKGKSSSSFQSLIFCQSILEQQQCLYGAAGKAKANLDKLVGHLGISINHDDQMAVLDGLLSRDEIPVTDSSSFPGPINITDQGIEMRSPQLNWGLSDLDLEAIAQGFRLDGELHYLMHPVGI
ncbi:hypothetical protein N7462_000998 [Penicillium macrosclerotiorum]|uniref:uncharacterized protein n=1 Tax=Penicillium macrosclerotiorum TaxID=303699 RepID=UPI002546805E|nr:uncharacterized protein N7462_000998 [Penicillium macrosclerotiorum]KAJ5698993.1 hypothetical protein N7462_000998 [Penicillium macrosclerotiorum]